MLALLYTRTYYVINIPKNNRLNMLNVGFIAAIQRYKRVFRFRADASNFAYLQKF